MTRPTPPAQRRSRASRRRFSEPGDGITPSVPEPDRHPSSVDVPDVPNVPDGADAPECGVTTGPADDRRVGGAPDDEHSDLDDSLADGLEDDVLDDDWSADDGLEDDEPEDDEPDDDDWSTDDRLEDDDELAGPPRADAPVDADPAGDDDEPAGPSLGRRAGRRIRVAAGAGAARLTAPVRRVLDGRPWLSLPLATVAVALFILGTPRLAGWAWGWADGQARTAGSEFLLGHLRVAAPAAAGVAAVALVTLGVAVVLVRLCLSVARGQLGGGSAATRPVLVVGAVAALVAIALWPAILTDASGDGRPPTEPATVTSGVASPTAPPMVATAPTTPTTAAPPPIPTVAPVLPRPAA